MHYIARYYIVFYVVYFSKLECVEGGSLTLKHSTNKPTSSYGSVFLCLKFNILRSLIFVVVSITLDPNVWTNHLNRLKTYENLIMKKQQRYSCIRQPKSQYRYIQYDIAIVIRSYMPIEIVSNAQS